MYKIFIWTGNCGSFSVNELGNDSIIAASGIRKCLKETDVCCLYVSWFYFVCFLDPHFEYWTLITISYFALIGRGLSDRCAVMFFFVCFFFLASSTLND